MSFFNLFRTDKAETDKKLSLSKKAALVFAEPPVLETTRLQLCRMIPDYAADMYEYSSDPEVTRYLTWSPHASPKETERYLRILQRKYADGTFHDWGLIHRKTGKFIGTCGYTSFDEKENTAEVGYVLAKPYWGMGLAAEAVKAVMHFGFEVFELDGFNAKYMEGNDASGRVMQKCGMTLEGVYRHSMYIKGEFKNIVVYRIDRESFYKTFENDLFYRI